jgi:hypothetical protein
MEFKTIDFEVKSSDSENLVIEHIISSQRRDRGNDVLYAGPNSRGKGMVTDGGKIVVLHSHGMNPVIGSEPVAKCLGLEITNFKGFPAILAKTQFFPDETGKRLFQKMTQGFAPSASVGWQPLISEHKTEDNGEQVRHCYEWLCLEYSVGLGVPMQPDAIFPGEGPKQEEGVLFKMLGQGQEKAEKPTFTVINIPDDFVQRVIKETVQEQIAKITGKVE